MYIVFITREKKCKGVIALQFYSREDYLFLEMQLSFIFCHSTKRWLPGVFILNLWKKDI